MRRVCGALSDCGLTRRLMLDWIIASDTNGDYSHPVPDFSATRGFSFFAQHILLIISPLLDAGEHIFFLNIGMNSSKYFKLRFGRYVSPSLLLRRIFNIANELRNWPLLKKIINKK